ncbi:single-stranded DNA-binding protein [Campylobacter corcagiensis]|uniref:Single-stranded DNA-binding protein n=1 Tax=Campylobacter corcagiensis TaxID=1448857 RepID=A0A7M1LED0_9BACT|nr:single-stranded DNA-binding protein [Campylobacter corcagiensis]QKF64911.1 single-stranded DNA binding protein [Campylobacter corcagiensis]QOQ86929.1 single-stranded DNA-binding protein [Campylobacter corcagiensis]
MFNKVILVGNLTRDIEMRYANSGSAIGNTGIAVNRRYNVNGEKREDVCFIDITFFGRTAEVANQYLRKGSQVLIEGRLQFDTWQDKNTGQNRNKHSIVVESMQMLSGGNQSGQQNYGGNQNYNNQNHSNQGGYSQGYDNYQSQNSKPNNNYQNKQNRGGYQNDSYDDYSENIPDIDIDEDELPF